MTILTCFLCALFAFANVSPHSASHLVSMNTQEDTGKYGDCVQIADGRRICVRKDEEGISHWVVYRPGSEAVTIEPATAMAMTAEFKLSPSGKYLATVSVGEGHPILDVFETEAVLGGTPTEPLLSINPYPGVMSIEEWTGDTLVVSSDMPLTLPEDLRRDYNLMFEDNETFTIAMPSGRIEGKSMRAAVGIVTLEGVVIEKPWSKTVESWNAGGSEYFVLDTGSLALDEGQRSADEGVILRPSSAIPFEDFKQFKGKRVRVTGKFMAPEAVEDNPASIEQRPVTPVDPTTGKRGVLRRGGGFLIVQIQQL